jgi:hypothetical protein
LRKNWTGRNVDLPLLTTRIGDFFKAKDFDAIRGEIPTGYQILAQDSPFYKIIGCMSVTIEGKPNDFFIDFVLDVDQKKRGLPRSIFFEQMLFGGYLLSRKIKSEEAWSRLEKEFWVYVENVVTQLVNSTENPT